MKNKIQKTVKGPKLGKAAADRDIENDLAFYMKEADANVQFDYRANVQFDYRTAAGKLFRKLVIEGKRETGFIGLAVSTLME
jgi:hypothetical protein